MEIPDPPFVQTNVQFTVTDQVRGTPPTALTTSGGVANGISVLASHGPNIRMGNSYLIFTYRNRIISASIMTATQTVAINGTPVPMADVRSAVTAAQGANP